MVRNVLLALAALLALATTAVAAQPVAGALYTGTTSQARGVAVRADSGVYAGQVRRFIIRWSTKCPHSRLSYAARGAFTHEPISTDGSFHRSFLYRETLANGYRARVFVRGAGRFVTASKATGTWRGAVRLFKAGRQVAYCRSPLITWSARRRPGA